jgi:hypothetical protein
VTENARGRWAPRSGWNTPNMSRRRIDCASFHAETPRRESAGAVGTATSAAVPEGASHPSRVRSPTTFASGSLADALPSEDVSPPLGVGTVKMPAATHAYGRDVSVDTSWAATATEVLAAAIVACVRRGSTPYSSRNRRRSLEFEWVGTDVRPPEPEFPVGSRRATLRA